MIGLFGGAFDPVHHGHLRPALEVFETLGLRELRFIPLNQAPHKQQPTLPAEYRYRLLEQALAGQPGFVADRIELARGGVSYTVETLATLRRQLPKASLALLLGTDAFAGLPGWHRWREILEMAHIVLMTRPNSEIDERRFPAGYLADRLVETPESLRAAPAGRILPVEVTQLDISSTRIRALLQQGRTPRYLMPMALADRLTRDWPVPSKPVRQ